MSDAAVSPERTVTLAGKEFVLKGNFGVLKAIQHVFREDILQVQARVPDMRQDEIVQLLAVGLKASDIEIAEDAISEAVIEIDISSVEYRFLKFQLTGWLAIAISPKSLREKKAKALDALLAELTARLASRGTTTNNSVSASSAGGRKRSGKATPGK